MDAYLDIETTGLSPRWDTITVVGIYRPSLDDAPQQLICPDITREKVEALLRDVRVLYTYNGKQFDARFLQSQLQVEFPASLVHKDLMYDCWGRRLYGGLKAVERHLEINRTLQGVSGLQAVELWWRYARRGDTAALATLLEYNREDVLNLKVLRERLGVD